MFYSPKIDKIQNIKKQPAGSVTGKEFYFIASEGNKDSQIFIAKRRRKYALHIYIKKDSPLTRSGLFFDFFFTFMKYFHAMNSDKTNILK